MKASRPYTYNSTKLFKREMFDGIGPSSPVACISLQSFKFKRNEIRNEHVFTVLLFETQNWSL
jgi:hypothetical protein